MGTAGIFPVRSDPDNPPNSSSVGFFAVTLVEFVNTTCGINKLLLTGKERVALGTDTDFVFRAGGFDFPDFAAGADDFGGAVVRMDIFLIALSPVIIYKVDFYLQYNLVSIKYTP